MKRQIAILLAFLPLMVWAYDFSAMVSSGQTLYFSFCNGGVKVVYPNSTSTPVNGWDGFNRPTGNLAIPAAITQQGVQYPVVEVAAFAFYGCSDLTSVIIQEGVATLGNSSMKNCSAMISIELPASLQSIGSQTLGSCTSLAHIHTRGHQPPTTHSSAFLGTTLSNVTLHLPCGSQSAWAVEVWSQVGSVEESPCSAILSVAVNDILRGVVTGGGSYPPGSDVSLSAVPAEGCFFAGWNDGDTANPRIVHLTADTLFRALFFVMRHDTILLTNTVLVHDTTIIHDSMAVHDTVYPTFYRLLVLSDEPSLGLGVGSATLPAGTEVEVCALPLQGACFSSWSDGNTDNPRTLTLTANTELRAFFNPLSISTLTPQWTVAVNGLTLTVGCTPGERLRLYDTMGRLYFETYAESGTTRLTLPSSGVWVLQVADGPAKKIISNN